MKRFLAIVLACAMMVGLIPSVYGTESLPAPAPMTEEDYLTADLIWDAVYAKEAEMHRKRAPLYDIIDTLITEVTSSPYYKDDSLIRNGDHFFWETTEGIPCGYSPRLAEEGRNAVPKEGYDLATAQTHLTTSYGAKAGHPGSRDVFLFQPYYGIDADFTEQYVTESNAIASALKGTATTYRTNDATIDRIADAIESGAVVIFDSHGDTDYANGQDYVSRANTSYICLQTNAGLTEEDFELASGPFGQYYHAFYAGSYGSMKYYCVDGTAIANHMESSGSNAMLWMALCLSMATDGLHAPLRERGVEIAYGYSQSVTFEYDYLWEEIFWREMRLGRTAAEAIALMKEDVGLWDWCHGTDYDTIAEAREKYSAFPIVVSTEDPYPGHGKVDDLQNVQSLWTLLEHCDHVDTAYIPHIPATCTTAGNLAHYLCRNCGALFLDEGMTQRVPEHEVVLPATGHAYDNGVMSALPTCTAEGFMVYTCRVCGHSYTEIIDAIGHNYAEGFCTNCGKEKPRAEAFEPGSSGQFVLTAKVKDTYYALPNSFTNLSSKLIAVEVDATHGFVEKRLAGNCVLELTYFPETDKYTIYNGTYYLKYSTATNLAGSTTPYYWTITSGVNGSWQFISETVTRVLSYRSVGYNCFGVYYKPNVVANGREYFDIEIIPIADTLSEDESCKHSRTEQTQTQPTCTTDGSIVIHCIDCGMVLSSTPMSSTGHVWNSGTITTEATCSAVGTKTYACTKCSETWNEELPMTDHIWDEGVIAEGSTCQTQGIIRYTCSQCSATKTDLLGLEPHDFENGSCILCGAIYTPDSNPFTVGSSGTFVLAANINGTYYALSNDFTASDSRIIHPVNGYVLGAEAEGLAVELQYDDESNTYCILHEDTYLIYEEGMGLKASDSYYQWMIADNTDGTLRIQSRTEDYYLLFRDGSDQGFGCYPLSNITALPGEYMAPVLLPIYTYQPGDDIPDWEPPVDDSITINHSLNLASDISMNYAVKTSMLEGYDSFQLHCDVPCYEYGEFIGYRSYALNPVLKDSYYYFSLTGITAVQMGDDILATIHLYKNGKLYLSETDVYSVADYAYGQLGKDAASPALKKLCAELLRYGAYAQQYKGYRTDVPVDRFLTPEQTEYCTPLDSVTFQQNNQILDDITDPTVVWAGKTLNLESKVVLRFIAGLSGFTGEPEELTLKVRYKNYLGEDVELLLSGPVVYLEEKKYYAFDLDALLAAELRCVVQAAVYHGDTRVSPTMVYSPDTYGNNKTGDLLELCKALISYSDTALDYFTRN